MRKFLAVVKREYLKLVWTWAFILGTILVPTAGIGFTVIPALIFSIEGDAVRLAVVDRSGRIYEPVKNALSKPEKPREDSPREALENQVNGSSEEKMRQTAEQLVARFTVEEIKPEGRSPEEVKTELNARLREQKLDAYIVIPADIETADYELYARNTSDILTQTRVERALNLAVREARMAGANLSREKLDEINRPVTLSTVRVSDTGESEDSGESFIFVFVVGFLMYLTLILYGQAILAAVVEEKETKIAEVLFSSARPFTLMIGKLVGVGLVALTQLAIWIGSSIIFAVYGLSQIQRGGFDFKLPNISPFFILGLFVFFLLGFFTYATIYALVGSMVTNVQEGGQLSFAPILLLLIAFYCAFPIIRSPGSNFAVAMSVIPFFSPILMPVRMAIQMPPFWQIGLAMLLSVAAIMVFTWVAARAYRIGMLMYGKKATIPEVLKWIRQQ